MNLAPEFPGDFLPPGAHGRPREPWERIRLGKYPRGPILGPVRGHFVF